MQLQYHWFFFIISSIYFIFFNHLTTFTLYPNNCSISATVNSLAGVITSFSVTLLPLRYHSLIPLTRSIVGPSSRWCSPLRYHSLVPLAPTKAGPSSRWYLPLINHSSVPLASTKAGPSSRWRTPLRYHILVPSS